VKISNVDAMRAAGLDVEQIGQSALRAAIKMLLIDGYFHADPHPGNLIVNTETGEVTFLDCGMVGELTVSQRIHLVWMLWAFTRGDIPAMGEQLRSLSVPFRPVDEERFRKAWERRMSRYSGTGGGDVAAVLSQGMGVLRDNGLRLDPQLTLAIKALGQASAFFKPLAPQGKTFSTAAIEAAQELGLEAFTEDAVRDAIKKESMKLAGQALQEAPEYVKGLLSWRDQVKRGKFTLYLDTSSLEEQVHGLQTIVNQIVVALLVGLSLIGTAFAAAAFSAQDGFETVARWSTIAFFASLAVGAVLVFLFLGSLIRERRRRVRTYYQ
jgi:ubiquinone biosynthesis protein